MKEVQERKRKRVVGLGLEDWWIPGRSGSAPTTEPPPCLLLLSNPNSSPSWDNRTWLLVPGTEDWKEDGVCNGRAPPSHPP